MEAFGRKTHHYLSACLIAKNEMRYMLEWIAFHKVVGFDHFYIYDNDSTDGTSSALQKLQSAGVCTYIDWPRSRNPDNPQVSAYRDALEKYGDDTTWLAIIDADEFIVPLTADRVDDILRQHFSEASSVLSNWKVFGSSGHEEDDGRFCIERFQRCSLPTYAGNTHVKAILKPQEVEIAFIHNHYMKCGQVVLSDGSLMDPERDQRTGYPVYGHFQLNHYYCKSMSEFVEKRSKGIADLPMDHSAAIRPLSMFVDSDRNEDVDERAAYFLRKTQLVYDELMSCIEES